VVLAAALLAPAAALAHGPSQPPRREPVIAAAASDTVKARRHFFGSENVDSAGRLRRDRVVLSWFSVASVAAAIDGHVVLLDTYIHKAEDRPNYVPTTTNELVALDPEAIFIGHGHFDHANTSGAIAARTGALVIGTPEHCDQAKAQAESVEGPKRPVRCLAAVMRASAPGAQVREISPLGGEVGVTVFKHIHSAAVAPDGEGHETSVASPGGVDVNSVLLHPPGQGTVAGLATSGDEGSSLLYQFRVGQFALTWHDTVGPLRERAQGIFPLLRRLPPTDVELGSTLGFNDPTNGQRDPVDYLVNLRPKLFFPMHHDFIAEYGVSKGLEGVFRRELARRAPVPTEVRWLYDPQDYLRPQLMTFDVESARFADARSCLARRSSIGRRNIGRLGVGLSRRRLLAQAPPPRRRTRRSWRWCIKGSSGSVRAAFSRRGRVALLASTGPRHGNRGVRPGVSAARLARAYPRRRQLTKSLYAAGTRIFGVRRGRVRFTGVASRGVAARPRLLRRYLRLAGLP
jgi:L-ascorbate metabolism protein UlaG (beta-lactamase superfamily)